MKRFELDPYVETQYSDYYRKNYTTWRVTQAERDLIQWLTDNVGKSWGGGYNFPCRGEGWGMYMGYGLDPLLDDYQWRYVSGVHRYKPQGAFGYWLQVDDDDKAVQLRLCGVLDPCLWTRERPHKCTLVRSTRSPNEPDYPSFYRA